MTQNENTGMMETIIIVTGNPDYYYCWKQLVVHREKNEILERIKSPDFVAAFRSVERARRYCHDHNFPEDDIECDRGNY